MVDMQKGGKMDDIQLFLEKISLKDIETHIKNLEGVRHPKVAPEALEKAADYIFTKLDAWGYEMSVHYFNEGDHKYRNIIGTHTGTKFPEKKVMVLAHYDTVATSPGANDNASGVAAMLEIARVIKRFRFMKSIQFVGVNLEERMLDEDKNSPFLRGSRALSRYARDEGWEIEGVINFEEIAYAGELVVQTKPDNFPLELPKTGNFIGIIGNQNSMEMVNGYIQIIEQYKIPLPHLPLVVPGNGEMFPDVRRSDHASFWDMGYPAIMLTDTANFRTPHYHQPSDVLDTLNLSFATEVCRSAGGLVMHMAGLEKL
jgi:hypothetical protein